MANPGRARNNLTNGAARSTNENRQSKGGSLQTLGLQGITQDITERKEAEEKIRFQARLLDAVGEAVIATDLEGKVVYWNRAAEELHGLVGRRGDRPSQYRSYGL
jgi:PAS domain-containing protein